MVPTLSDTYYIEESKKALEKALAECRERGCDAVRTRFHLRKSYPFGAIRKGKAYKHWLKVILPFEAELGYEPKRWKKTQEKLERQNAAPNSILKAATFLPLT